jgi:hypothetical protein
MAVGFVSFLGVRGVSGVGNPLSNPALNNIYQENRDLEETQRQFCASIDQTSTFLGVLMETKQRQLAQLQALKNQSPTVASWRAGIEAELEGLNQLSYAMQPALQKCGQSWY